MPKYIVRSGDCIATIAAAHGLAESDLLDRSANADLKRARENPYVLSPGDIVDVPEPSDGPSLSSGGTHRFRASIPTARLRVRVLDRRHEPVRNRRYELTAGTRTLNGTTDGDGFVEAHLRVIDREAVLRISTEADGSEMLVLPLLIGHLDPAEESSGIHQRLTNLGYGGGDRKQSVSSALREFQEHQGLDVTGSLDDATKQRLVERHGS